MLHCSVCCLVCRDSESRAKHKVVWWEDVRRPSELLGTTESDNSLHFHHSQQCYLDRSRPVIHCWFHVLKTDWLCTGDVNVKHNSQLTCSLCCACLECGRECGFAALLLASLALCLNHHFLFSIPTSAYPSFHKHTCVFVCVDSRWVRLHLPGFPWVVVVGIKWGCSLKTPLKLRPNQLAPRADLPQLPDRQTDPQTYSNLILSPPHPRPSPGHTMLSLALSQYRPLSLLLCWHWDKTGLALL